MRNLCGPQASKGFRAIRVADEVWVATALLHREQPERPDFTIEDIIRRAEKEGLSAELRPGVKVHAYTHCVANKEPDPGRYRMLFATGSNTRRLYRPSDIANPQRTGKMKPRRDQIPARYHELLGWYESEYCLRTSLAEPDLLDELRGSGREIWRDEDPDEYVRRLREGWE